MPPENGTISLFIAAMVGKRADSAVHARSAWAWFWNAPSWITLPAAPEALGGSGSAATGDLGLVRRQMLDAAAA